MLRGCRGGSFGKSALVGACAGWALLAAGQAGAAGFALKEQSAAAQGNAFAGATAGAEDVSYMFFNPAALGYTEGYGGSVEVALVLPNGEVTSASGSTILGQPITGTSELSDVGENAAVPALYLYGEASEQLRFGLGVNAPFGLATNYPESWVGRYHAVESSLFSLNFNPAVAYTPFPGLTLGAGVQAQYLHVELSNAVDLSTVAALSTDPPTVPPPALPDGLAEIEGEGWQLGFNLGAIYEPLPGTRLGVAYRSGFEQDLEGDADFTIPAAVQAGAPQLAALFADTDVEATADLPGTLSFGAYHELDERFAVMAEAAWTRWSVFETLEIEFDSALPNSVTREDWDDSWFLALGGTYRPRDDLTLRLGVAFDDSPISNARRTPRIPTNDRYWIAAGLGFEPAWWLTVDLAYTHIFVDDSTVRLRAAEEGEATRGNLDVEYENSIDLLAAAITVRF